MLGRCKIFIWWLLFGFFTLIPNCFAENPWLIRINIPEFRLHLYKSGEIYDTYQVAVGKINSPSPLGDYWIVNKVVNPTWYPPDGKPPVPSGPNNPLGGYWMGLNKEGYGIHGNSAAWSIGNPVSLGCFRLHNKDIQKLFQLVPVGTPVEIRYQTVKAVIDKNNQAWIEVYPDIYHIANLENEIAGALINLNWAYQVHRKALTELLRLKAPLKVEVPRQIIIEGVEGDGFYWGGEIYFAKSSLKTLPVNTTAAKENSIFADYIKLDLKNPDNPELRYFWDTENNTLRAQHLKVLLNGVDLNYSVRWYRGRVKIHLQKIASVLNTSFLWDGVSGTATCGGMTSFGDVKDGSFWTEIGDLDRIWPGIDYFWDERSGILEINYQ